MGPVTAGTLGPNPRQGDADARRDLPSRSPPHLTAKSIRLKRRKFLQATPVGLAAALAVPRATGQRLNGFDLRDSLIPAEAILGGGPQRDGIPSIDRPRFIPASRSGLGDSDRVLGLVRQGQARAYPIRILNWHEVVNDRFGDEAVAITYCPLCGTGMAFDARVQASVLSFGVSGLLYNSDVLLYDRQTESLWSQIMAQAVTGPMRGRSLTSLPMTHTRWAAWRARHPGTTVLSPETGHVREYSYDPYEGYEQVPRLMFAVQHRDDRVYMKEWVLGLRLGGQAKAYPFERLARQVDARGRLRDQLGGQAVEIRYDRNHGSAEAFVDIQGQALPAVMAFWFAWAAFHPQTELLADAQMPPPSRAAAPSIKR